MIYLDHNATTPPDARVLDAMAPFLRGRFGNASSAHAVGRDARAAVERGRRAVAAAVGARPAEIVFTSGGTESNNLALFGIAAGGAGAHLVVSPIEHSSVVASARELERRGAEITWLPVDGAGRVEASGLAAALRDDTVLVSVGWANNEIGTIQPIAELGAVCRARGVPFHVDAAQAFGKISVDVADVDLCTFSAHKLGAPVGAGALFVRRGVRLRPLLFGGGQERGLRPGTENAAALVGFGAAAEMRGRPGPMGAALRERLCRGIAGIDGCRRNSPAAGCLWNTLNVSIEGIRGESLIAALDLEGIAASVGSACAAGAGEPSHVLRAIGRSEDEARDGVRFSLGFETTAREIDIAVETIRAVVERMRRTPSRWAATG
jgi:cysteine desulfurase